MDALGVRRDLALGERAHVRADLVERLVERPREPAGPGDRGGADRAHRIRRRRSGDRSADGIVVARFGQAQRRRDRFEPVAQALREIAGGNEGRRREPSGNLRELRDHARLGRRVRDAFDDDLVIVGTLAVAGQRAGRLDGALGEHAGGGSDVCQLGHAHLYATMPSVKRALVSVLMVCATHFAFADKHYVEGHGGTWDCAKDGVIAIDANAGKYTFKGACKSISINGNSNDVTLESTATLSVNGNTNKVTATSADALLVPGNENSVTVKKPPGTSSNPGTNNKITVPKDKK